MSRDYSLLVFIQYKAGGGQSNKKIGTDPEPRCEQSSTVLLSILQRWRVSVTQRKRYGSVFRSQEAIKLLIWIWKDTGADLCLATWRVCVTRFFASSFHPIEACGRHSDEKLRIQSQDANQALLIWIRKFTISAICLAMLKGYCYEILCFWFSSNRKLVLPVGHSNEKLRFRSQDAMKVLLIWNWKVTSDSIPIMQSLRICVARFIASGVIQ